MSEPERSPEQYRWRLLVSELRREAERNGEADVRRELDALGLRLEQAATLEPSDLERLRVLAARFGRELERGPEPVRWQSFLRFSGPGLLVLVLAAVLIERRRRRQREVSAAALARLETDVGPDAPGP